jgi:hypothetical protein
MPRFSVVLEAARTRYNSRPVPPDLNRKIRIYISRTGMVAHAEIGSAKQGKLLRANKGYRPIASVDLDDEAWSITDRLCEHLGPGTYVIPGLSLSPTNDELQQTEERFEAAYQDMKKETGEILP